MDFRGINTTLRRRVRRPGVVFAVLFISIGFIYVQWLPGNMGLGHLGHTIIIPLLTSLVFGCLSPIPWQWNGNNATLPNFCRGLIQAVISLEIVLLLLVVIDAYFCRLIGLPFDLTLTFKLNGVIWAPLMVIIGYLIATIEQGALDKEQAQAQAHKAQIRALQGQLHPHVLFNALNGLAELVHKNPEEAETSIRHLSDLLRKVIRATDDPDYSLQKEWEILNDYLHMEGLRLGKRLRLEWDLDPALDGLNLPPLLLQPLIENALKHGIAPCREGGELRIQSRREGAEILLTVGNTGESLRKAQTDENSVGIANLKSRLRLAFGNSAGFSLRTSDRWTLAEIRLPWVASGDKEEAHEDAERGRRGGRVPGSGAVVPPPDGAGLPGRSRI